jgi:hypothetical protein
MLYLEGSVVMVLFEELFRLLPEGTEDNHIYS